MSPTLDQCLRTWTEELTQVSDTPRLDAEVLFKYSSSLTDVQLILQSDQILCPKERVRTQILIDARREGRPIAYLCGYKEFYGLKLKVNQHVLIPRPETELLVDVALQGITAHAKLCLDLGTGSGAIALAMATQAPNLKVVGVDKDLNAIKVATENSKRLNINNVTFQQSDWYAGIDTMQFDLILANPPYVAPNDKHLSIGDVRYEPQHALVAQNKGLADLRQIIQNAPQRMNKGGVLIVEHGYDQGEYVHQLFINQGFEKTQSVKDLAGNDRLCQGWWRI